MIPNGKTAPAPQKTDLAKDPYVVLARRTRPQSLQQLVGQDAISSSLTSMLQSGHLPHAFLFTGTRGTGKTSTARILAKSLCCVHGPTPTPCQTCVHCTHVTSCSHDDVIEIDGASHTGVDHVRELNEAARFYPRSAKYKIFIIDEVHMLSTGAFNALLKTLEEPPQQVVFILATTELHKVPTTVRSRCLTFSFRKLDMMTITGHLQAILAQDGITADSEALQLVARSAQGSVRDALSLLEQVLSFQKDSHLKLEHAKEALGVQGDDLAERLFCAICERKADEALEVLKEADDVSLDGAQLVELTAGLFRAALVIKTAANKERALRIVPVLSREYDLLLKSVENLSVLALGEIFKLLARSVREIGRASAPLAWAQIVVIDCITRSEWLSPSAALKQASALVLSPSETPLTSPPVPLVGPKAVPTPSVAPKASTAPQASAQPADGSVDMTLFKEFVEKARAYSTVLATKLSFVKMNRFQKTGIEFADTRENATYFSFGEQDGIYFWKSIQDAGLESTPIKGPHLPPRARDAALPAKEGSPLQNAQNLERSIAPHARAKASGAPLQQPPMPTGPLIRPVAPGAASPSPVAEPPTSLYDSVQQEKRRVQKEKKEHVLAKEAVRQLSQFAKVDVLPRDGGSEMP